MVEVSRSSLFVGGGPVISNAPLTGGSGGPARLAMDLSIADAIFEPLYRCQLVHAARENADAVFNTMQYRTGAAYYELVRSQAIHQTAQKNYQDANDVLEMIESYVEAGKGSPADVSRIKVIVQQQRQEVTQRQGEMQLASNQLANILQLDLSTLNEGAGLLPVDQGIVAVTMIDSNQGAAQLIQQALHSRPEIQKLQSQIGAASSRSCEEAVRPLLPNLHIGGSMGGFGGGTGSDIVNLDGRADLDVILAWQIKNLGAGNSALRRERTSQFRQAQILMSQARDAIINEVNGAYFQIRTSEQQLDTAKANVDDADDALQRTIARIRGFQGDPLELIQSLQLVRETRSAFIDSVVDYNISQLKMLRAVGSSGTAQ